MARINYVYCQISNPPHLGCEHVFDTINGAMKSEAPDQVDKEDHIWKCGCEVHNLQMEPNSKVRVKVQINNLILKVVSYNSVVSLSVCILPIFSIWRTYLSSWLYSLDNEQVGNHPCKQEAQCLACMNASILFNRRRDVQCFPVEEVLGGCSPFTLLYRSCPVGIDGAFCPGQDWLGWEWTQNSIVMLPYCPIVIHNLYVCI